MLRRLAMLSVHTSPLAPLGGEKTGGMNVYINELARELGSRGILIDIFTRRYGVEQPQIDYSLGANVRVIHIVAGPPEILAPDAVFAHIQQFSAGVIAFATKEQISYDFVYSHYWLSGLVAQTLKTVWGIPFAQMFHTLGEMKKRLEGVSVAQSASDTRITYEERIARWADSIIAATPAEHAQLLWLYHADRRKISIVPPGVNTKRFYPLAKDSALSAIGLSADTRLLLFTGRIEPLKGIETIFRALHRLLKQDASSLRNVKLAIIGGDPGITGNAEMKRLQALAEDLHIMPDVMFLGAKTHSTLHQYYAAARAVLMPSDYESFGMVALEAMAAGTPVIASQVGGLAFLVKDGETGFLVPVRDSLMLSNRIQILLQDELLATRLGQAAAQRAQEYTWASIADRLLDTFRTVLPNSETASTIRHTN